ncbi:MAG TPA: DUF1285 domain-containing protein [Stellaceae bacterium]|jgi:hypothetical protein|nr:DUF1285 domain-containing protein [Stellaceae bacterium]
MGDVEAKVSQSSKRGGGGKQPTLVDNLISNTSSSAKRRGDVAPPPFKRSVVDHGDLDMRIARDGTWFYRGTPINRQPLVKLFASVLRREDDGTYWLVTPVERGRIDVEDAPFLAVEVNSEGAGRDRRLTFRTNIDEIVTAGPEHTLRIVAGANGEPEPYILVRPGLEARLNRPVFYELVDLADAERGDAGGPFGLWSGGVFFDLGDPEDE